MRYMHTIAPNFTDDDLEYLLRSLLHDNTLTAVILRDQIRDCLDARDFMRNVSTPEQARQWIPPSLKPS